LQGRPAALLSEARGLIGILLRKYNKFEFDGTKNLIKNE
jgi:hypothetical protein